MNIGAGKTSEKKTIVCYVLDESGSMHWVKDETIEGFNEYVDTLRIDPIPTLLRLQTFNSSQSQEHYRFEDIRKVTDLDALCYRPRGRTPLLDAVGNSIVATEEFLLETLHEDIQVIFAIMTDGLENWSNEYTHRMIRHMIQKKQAEGWIFSFLGADQDAWRSGRRLGIKTGNSSSYDAGNPKAAFRANARGTMRAKRRFLEGLDPGDFFKEPGPKS